MMLEITPTNTELPLEVLYGNRPFGTDLFGFPLKRTPTEPEKSPQIADYIEVDTVNNVRDFELMETLERLVGLRFAYKDEQPSTIIHSYDPLRNTKFRIGFWTELCCVMSEAAVVNALEKNKRYREKYRALQRDFERQAFNRRLITP